jgi:hypothetical protein
MRHRLLLCLVLGSCWTWFLLPPVRADVGDPTVETNHPRYSGEGAFQTVEQCVARATAGKNGVQDRAIALYLWILSHQWHSLSPQEWNVPGLVPDPAQETQFDMIVQDANRARFSYGYGLCGTVHAWNEVYWRALGLRARRRGFPGHTNSEIEYGGSWHAFDTDMAGLLFRKDGVVAGYEDVVRDPGCFDRDHWPLPRYPFAWPQDFEAMRAGWKEVARGGAWPKMYQGGYAAQPAIVHLRAGETFTRYFDPDHFGGIAERRFWHHQAPGGPFRDWTFANLGTPTQQGGKCNCHGNATYCNGEFVYHPNLTTVGYREGVVHESANVGNAGASPHLRSRDGGQASVIFEHFSPYVICGRPADGCNSTSAPATGGLVLAGQAVGAVNLSVSADLGQTWVEAGTIEGKFERDLTEAVKGRYGWQLRFTWEGNCGLDDLTCTTVTQVSQAIYPRLRPGGCEVTYRAAARAVAPVLPDFGAPEPLILALEEKAFRSANVVYTGRSPKSLKAYSVQGNKPAVVVYKVTSPTQLLQVSAAAQVTVPVPPPAEGCDFHLDLSTDGGKRWQLLGRADIPSDHELSSAWIYGQRDIAESNARVALIRVCFYAGGYALGLKSLELYGLRVTAPPQALTLTYAWKEGAHARTYHEFIPAGTRQRSFQVPTGTAVVDEYVRLEVP